MIRNQPVNIIPDEIAEHLKELYPQHVDFEDILQDQETVYQSLKTNNRSNWVEASDHDQSNDQRHFSESGGQFSESVESQLDLDEAIARSLEDLDRDFENVSISESIASAAGNTGVNSSETSVVVLQPANQDDVDPDSMSYEQLQSLGETIGSESRGLSQELISRLPCQKYKSGFFSRKIKYKDCVICSTEFRKGEWLTTLPCKHQYHKECIEPWLGNNKTCPLCKIDVSES